MKNQLTLIGLFTTSKKPLSLQIPIYFKEKIGGFIRENSYPLYLSICPYSNKVSAKAHPLIVRNH
ncbi:hypothetical protein BBP23_02635 [Chlamydia trachomatis]|nr:hypothetical protein BBP23_02635 [Chlamydia trachomatis]AOQ16615.1 hypothetical protein BBV13_02570 [Chlamydia trachomatis]AOQ17477.1 hypothetical protein BBV14_02580 [Chlamydia trachomatis]AOQ18344.1 hypothetical protein BBV15_02570 [Chlamydia trachomatis]AOQ19246.1 hypothetical protein BBV16_02580 [Chlamydia trachomatis]